MNFGGKIFLTLKRVLFFSLEDKKRTLVCERHENDPVIFSVLVKVSLEGSLTCPALPERNDLEHFYSSD